MGLFDIIHFTEASLEQKEDEPSVWACFGFYPKEITWTNLLYEAVLYGEHLSKPQKAIVKLRRFRPGTEQFWQSRLDANIHASGVASVYTEKTGAGKINFARLYLAPLKGYSRWEKFCRSMKEHEFRDFKKDEIVLIQPLVSDCLTDFQEDIVLDAFSHFSYIEGKHQSVITTFKGRKSGNEYTLITPKILTSQKEINEFFSEHVCNDLCGGWNKPNVLTTIDNPLFSLPSDHLRLQKQTSVYIEEPGQHALRMRMPPEHCGILKNPTAPEYEDPSASPSKKKVTTIMHAVYVHDDSQHDEKEKRAPVQNLFNAPYIDTAIQKERKNQISNVIKNDTELSSPRTKAKPVRVHTMANQNIGMPKQLNIRQDEKPEIKPKPEIKQKPVEQKPEVKQKPEKRPKPEVKLKPEKKPKPEIKPKPKLQRQERTVEECESFDKIDAQKTAVQDELKKRFSKLALKDKCETQSDGKYSQETKTNSQTEPENTNSVILPQAIKSDSEVIQNKEISPNIPQIPATNVSNTAAESPKCTEKKVKSKKSLRKQAALAT